MPTEDIPRGEDEEEQATTDSDQPHESSPSTSSQASVPSPSPSAVKTSSDWMTLFLGSRAGRGLESRSIYSSTDSGGDSKMPTYSGSRYSGSSSYGSRYYSSATSGYLSASSGGSGSSSGATGGTSSSRSFRTVGSSLSYSSPYSGTRRSRFGRRRDEEDATTTSPSATAKKETDTAKKDTQKKDDSKSNGDAKNADSKRKKKPRASTVINGNVIRISKPKKGSSGSESVPSSSSDSEEEAKPKEPTPPPTPPPKPPTPPPPEDPLDVEERMLKAQLALSFTLTMTDEENIRQRMLEIKKTKMKRKSTEVETGLINRFERESDQLAEPTRAKEAEEKILITRLTAETLREVEQKDIQVRLQEIFRDRKSALEVTQKHMETHYEHLLQENSTELCELDSSIRNKQQQIDKIQEEMLSLVVRKELLSSAMEKVNHRHQEQLEQVQCQRREIDDKMSQYAVLAPPPCARRSASTASGAAEEMRELEQELECPVCMDISRPPIYQCEEGHIICSACKPLLDACPHCARAYSNPVIRCRFAEKLADKYLKMAETLKEEEEEKGRDEAKKEGEVLDLLQ